MHQTSGANAEPLQIVIQRFIVDPKGAGRSGPDRSDRIASRFIAALEANRPHRGPEAVDSGARAVVDRPARHRRPA